MSALPISPGGVYVTSYGAWHFTRHITMSPALIAMFYALYTVAFEPLKKLSAARQVLTEQEFRDQMLDERVDKYVAWDEGGRAVGLTTLTRALDSVPWISPDYFATRYPEHWARNAVYYLGFTLIHPSQRHGEFLETLVRVGMDQALTEHAAIAYDVCAHNRDLLRFEERLTDLLATVPGARLEHIDTQIYSCVTWP